MDANFTHNHPQLKKNVPELRAGDRVRVHQKIQEGGKSRIQVFEGLIIKTQHGRGINGSFTVRRISLGVGVEKCFPLHMPAITKIEKLKSTKVRRAKLYYIRGLIGKAAKRLKKEKENKEVWEDVIAEGDEVESEKLKVESNNADTEKNEVIKEVATGEETKGKVEELEEKTKPGTEKKD